MRASQTLGRRSRRGMLAALVPLLLLPGCGGEDGAAADGRGPYHEDTLTDPARFRVEPEAVSPGEEVGLTFPKGDTRGPGFVIERQTPHGWEWEWAAHHDPGGAPPRTWSADEHERRGVEWTAGPAFDSQGGGQRLRIPPEATPGRYRVCLVVGVEPALCAAFDVTDE